MKAKLIVNDREIEVEISKEEFDRLNSKKIDYEHISYTDYLLDTDAEYLYKRYCSRCDINWCDGPRDEFHREFCPYYREIVNEWHEKNQAEIRELEEREIRLRALR